MYKTIWAFLCAFSLYPSFCQVNIAPAPDWVTPITFESQKTEIAPNQVSGGYVYLLVDKQYRVKQEDSYIHHAFKILTENGVQNASRIDISYDPSYERIVFHHIRIIRDGKWIDKLKDADFQIIQREQNAGRHIYDGSLSAILNLKDVRTGDIIDYSFSRMGRNPVYKNNFFTSFYLNYYDPIGKISVIILSPENRELQHKNMNHTQAPKITREGNLRRYHWVKRNPESIITDNNIPGWFDPYPMVMVSEFSSWMELNRWALDLYQHSSGNDALLLEKVAAIKNTHKTKQKQIKAALRFVQDEIRYLGLEAGISGYKPHPPSQVLRQRFGDCKDKALLLCAMLRGLGVKAYPALVNTNYGKSIASWLPSPNAFNHCVVQVSYGDTTLWYDATLSHQGGAYDNIFFPNYQKALVIREGTSELSTILPNVNSRTQVTESFAIEDFESDVRFEVTTKYFGSQADNQRLYFKENSQQAIEKDYLNYYANIYPGLQNGTDFSYSDDAQRNVFTTYENYTIQNFWAPADSSNINLIYCEVYPQLIAELLMQPGSANRSMPLYLSYPSEMEHSIVMQLPEKWNMQEGKGEFGGKDVRFNYEISLTGNTLRLDYLYKTLADHVPPENIRNFIKVQNDIANQLGVTLSYNKSIQSVATVNYMFALVGVLALILAVLWVRKLYFSYDPQALPKRYAYDAIGGWLVLVGVGIVLRPFLYIFTLLSNNYFNKAVFDALIDAGSLTYNPGLATLFLGEYLVNIILLVFSLFLLVLFFKKRSSFPRLFQIYLVAQCGLIWLDILLVYSMDMLDQTDQIELFSNAIQNTIYMIIWFPYFAYSDRVKETFVNRLQEEDQNMQAITASQEPVMK